MEEDNIRNPDKIFRDRLISSIEDEIIENEYDYDMNQALEESRKAYEQQLLKEQIKNHRTNLFKKLDIQLSYLMLQKCDYIIFFMECYNNEKNKFLENENNHICLFKSHYEYLKKFIDEIYTRPLKKNKNPKIDHELFDLLIIHLKYC
tara:strand:- start:88 stop:531 length:444 start_codon:yes stop_codon:yes gene_type:complete